VSEPRDVPAGLLESAREDAAAARLITDAEVPDRIVGFHAQQAVEMFLKAVLAMRGVGYERTHDIERLTSLVSNRLAATAAVNSALASGPSPMIIDRTRVLAGGHGERRFRAALPRRPR